MALPFLWELHQRASEAGSRVLLGWCSRGRRGGKPPGPRIEVCGGTPSEWCTCVCLKLSFCLLGAAFLKRLLRAVSLLEVPRVAPNLKAITKQVSCWILLAEAGLEIVSRFVLCCFFFFFFLLPGGWQAGEKAVLALLGNFHWGSSSEVGPRSPQPA